MVGQLAVGVVARAAAVEVAWAGGAISVFRGHRDDDISLVAVGCCCVHRFVPPPAQVGPGSARACPLPLPPPRQASPNNGILNPSTPPATPTKTPPKLGPPTNAASLTCVFENSSVHSPKLSYPPGTLDPMTTSAVWAALDIPLVSPDGWSRDDVAEGLSQLQRLRRSIDAASALLMTTLAALCGRDANAAAVRASGISSRAAREQARLAAELQRIPGALAALHSGKVSVEHLRSLEPVENSDDAAALLVLAVGDSPEDFRSRVERFLLDQDEDSARRRQAAARGVSFFNGRDGCVGIRAMLTQLEGAELKSRLAEIADAAWRRAHPERSERLGAHGDDTPYSQRLADALMELVRGQAGRSGRPAIVVTVDAETLAADIIGTGPVPLNDVLGFSERADFYAAIRGIDGAILKFGRSRRLASPLQRLAATVRDRTCIIKGCGAPAERCHVHHVVPFEDGGETDLDGLALLCSKHHAHTHEYGHRIVWLDGEWILIEAEAEHGAAGGGHDPPGRARLRPSNGQRRGVRSRSAAAAAKVCPPPSTEGVVDLAS